MHCHWPNCESEPVYQTTQFRGPDVDLCSAHYWQFMSLALPILPAGTHQTCHLCNKPGWMKYVARDKILTVLCIAHGEEFVRGDLPLGEGQPPPAPPVASVPPPAPPTPAPQPLRPTDRSCIRSVVRRSQKRFRDKILPVAQERRRFKQRIKTLCHWCGDTTGGRIMFKGRGKGRQSAPICDDCYDEITGKSNGFNILAGWNRNRVFGCGHIDWHESGSSFDNIVRAAEEVATGGADD